MSGTTRKENKLLYLQASISCKSYHILIFHSDSLSAMNPLADVTDKNSHIGHHVICCGETCLLYFPPLLVGGVRLFCGKGKRQLCSQDSLLMLLELALTLVLILVLRLTSFISRWPLFTSAQMLHPCWLYQIRVKYPSSDPILSAKFKCHPTIPCDIPVFDQDINALWYHISDDLLPTNWSSNWLEFDRSY